MPSGRYWLTDAEGLAREFDGIGAVSGGGVGERAGGGRGGGGQVGWEGAIGELSDKAPRLGALFSHSDIARFCFVKIKLCTPICMK